MGQDPPEAALEDPELLAVGAAALDAADVVAATAVVRAPVRVAVSLVAVLLLVVAVSVVDVLVVVAALLFATGVAAAREVVVADDRPGASTDTSTANATLSDAEPDATRRRVSRVRRTASSRSRTPRRATWRRGGSSRDEFGMQASFTPRLREL